VVVVHGLERKVATGVDVRLVAGARVEQHPVGELEALLRREHGFVWVDVPTCDEEAIRVLSEVFGFHPLAVRDCVERNHVAKVHAYPDHVFVVLHAPEGGKGGHVHYIELDQFVGPNYLVTVHGPLNPAVPAEVAFRETRAVLQRVESGRLCPSSPFELSYSIVSALTRHQEAFVAGVAREVGLLEQRVMREDVGHSEQFLEELFRAQHGLVAVRTMAALSGEIYGRLATLTRFVPSEGQPLVADLVDQFTRVRGMAEGQREFLHGVIEFYQTRTETKMTIAAERLAVIAVVTLPITALSSVYGMNIIVNGRTDFWHLAAVLAVMAAISATLLRWARRQGWW
jgi:magnesium transporter